MSSAMWPASRKARSTPSWRCAKKSTPLTFPKGYRIAQHTAGLPESDRRFAMKWDGEWHITYEVFRDLGIAFAVVLVLIFVLVVGWFQSFSTPLVIMAAIPFSLIGILPAHWLMGAFFTATSMIGFIAGAGIVVRNSIILVDFIELRLAQGMPLDQAVIDAGAVRFRPMMLTAAAVVVGASVILFDPIFQGLAISLMAGEVASLLFSRMTVPILYYLNFARFKVVGHGPHGLRDSSEPKMKVSFLRFGLNQGKLGFGLSHHGVANQFLQIGLDPPNKGFFRQILEVVG